MRDVLRGLRLIISTAFRADPGRAIASILLEPLSRIAVPLFGVWLKLLADGALRHDAHQITVAALGFAASIGAFWGAGGIGNTVRISHQERVGFAFERKLAELVANVRGIEHHERPDYLDRVELVRTNLGGLGNTVSAIVNTAAAVVLSATTCVLLAAVHPLLLTLPLFALPSFWATARSQTMQRLAQEQSAITFRRSLHLYFLGTEAPAAKELRIYGLQDELRNRHRESMEAGIRVGMHARRATAGLQALGSVAFALGFVGSIVLVATLVVRGERTPGDLLLTLTVAGQVSTAVQWLVGQAAWMQRSLQVAGWFVWVADYARGQNVQVGSAAPPARLRGGIQLEHVSFRYPGTDRDVLSDVSFDLAPGTVVAIVGENGAGKTTLVKLLTRMYEPTSGRIRVDGTSLADINLVAWRARTAAAFQDFVRLELTAQEAVGVGDLQRIDDPRAVQDALSRADGQLVVDGLPKRLETQLGKTWEGGIDLSEGQWQRIALARALMRTEPLILVLDEPTASIDAETEHALFERFAQAARTTDKSTVTILVSHRFSTVRMADTIVVVDAGRIAERGSHDQLISRGGLYAELYELQARAYR